MDVDDKELFSSAMNDEPVTEVVTDAPAEPAAETPQQDKLPRDEQGRFAPKQAEQSEPAPAPAEGEQTPAQAKDEANVPSWRLREVREEAERRIAETEARWQRQFIELQRQSQPKPELKPAPDLYDNPDGFVDHRLQQGLTPIEQRLQAQEQRMQAQLEYTSRRDAFKEYGEETVRNAYTWLAQGIQSRDPDVVHVYQQVMQSEHPYDATVQAFKRASILQQIGKVGDLDKWAIQRAQELSGAQQQQNRQPSSGQQPQGSIVKLPPSLRNAPAARVAAEDDTDMSDAALFRQAMR